MNYTFWISYEPSSIVQQVYPLNWLDCTLVDEKEKDQIFYRRKFEGSLTFGGKKLCPDFDMLYAQEVFDPCAAVYLLILSGTDIYWEGYFSTSMGEWDLDNQTFTVTPLTIDDYNEWEESGNTEVNILQYITPLIVNYDDGSDTETYEQCLVIGDVIQYLARQFDNALTWGVSILSDFLTNATNPVTLSTNKYNHLFLSQKSDVKRPNSTNPATVGMMSFNQLMEILRCMNLRWEYVAGVLTIEHVSNWTSAAGLDIRTQEMVSSTNKYKYLKEEAPKFEKFSWMEANNRDFVGEPIWYDSACVNQDSKNNTTKFSLNVTTDLDYIRDCIADVDLVSNISDDGWFLFATTLIGPDYYVTSNLGVIETSVSHFNNDLSWSTLHNRFFRHDRVLIEGYMNGFITPETFYSAKKIKQQECSIILCDTFNPEEYLTTELGETYFDGEKGYVRKAVIKPYGEINLTLNYGPVESNVTPEPEVKTIYIWESSPAGDPASGTCGQLFATLSESVPIGGSFNLYINNRVRDEFGNIQCTGGAPETWSFAEGVISEDYLITFCTPLLAGWCWEEITDWTEAEALGWTVIGINRNEWIPNCACM